MMRSGAREARDGKHSTGHANMRPPRCCRSSFARRVKLACDGARRRSRRLSGSGSSALEAAMPQKRRRAIYASEAPRRRASHLMRLFHAYC